MAISIAMASTTALRRSRWSATDGRFARTPGSAVAALCCARAAIRPWLPWVLDNRISSVRDVNRNARPEDPRYAPVPVASPDYRRRNDERLYEAHVTSVHAVLGAPEQRCWVEREQVVQERGAANVPGAIAGAIIGGILGHQVGGGTGKDLATVGGAVAGAAVGANVGRNGTAQAAPAQNVQRCENVPSQAQPQYWDVTYNFRGLEHRIQMTAPPGPTVTVNEQGEPRR